MAGLPKDYIASVSPVFLFIDKAANLDRSEKEDKMKAIQLSLIVFAALVFAVGSGGTVFAFHSGGVAECGGCHSVHTPAPGSTFLLKQNDQSSTCLNCHQIRGDTGPSSFHISTDEADMPQGSPPLQLTPGGDFGWLKKNYTYTADGVAVTEDGSTHGHNIVAIDYNYQPDPVNVLAPGGTFPAAALACNSCHDPHGRYRRLSDGTVAMTTAPIIASGSYDDSPVPGAGEAVGVYRLLAGSGYTKEGLTFNGNPAAVTPAVYNRSESATQTRTAYGAATTGGHDTWGNWCAVCHPDMHSAGNTVHAVDEGLGTDIAALYYSYIKSGDMTGSAATSFLSLVPFAENTSDYAALATHAKNDDSQLGGPASSDQVMCLSCHRAHASGWENMLRWNNAATFIVYNSNWPGTDTTPAVPEFAMGRLSAETRAANYDRVATTFATYQRVLCNKCHAMD